MTALHMMQLFTILILFLIQFGQGYNANSLDTNADQCMQPRETGPCRAAFIRYYYNAEAGSCKMFTYGGCGGNDNKFDTKRECQQVCQPQ